MKTFYVYRLVNDEGHVLNETVVDDRSDNLCIGGYGNDGKYYQYDSHEAWHASSYFEKLDVGLNIVSTEVTIDTDDYKFE